MSQQDYIKLAKELHQLYLNKGSQAEAIAAGMPKKRGRPRKMKGGFGVGEILGSLGSHLLNSIGHSIGKSILGEKIVGKKYTGLGKTQSKPKPKEKREDKEEWVPIKADVRKNIHYEAKPAFEEPAYVEMTGVRSPTPSQVSALRREQAKTSPFFQAPPKLSAAKGNKPVTKGTGKPRGRPRKVTGGMERDNITQEEYKHAKRMIYADFQRQIDTLNRVKVNINNEKTRKLQLLRDRLHNTNVVLRTEAKKEIMSKIKDTQLQAVSLINRVKSDIRDLEDRRRSQLNNPKFVANLAREHKQRPRGRLGYDFVPHYTGTEYSEYAHPSLMGPQ